MPRCLLVLTLVVSVPAGAAEAPAPAVLEAGLAGTWHGALGYRDYQSNALFELTVDTDIRALADGATVIRVSRFDEGPKKAAAFITTASLFSGTDVAAATLRGGRPVEVATDRVRVTRFADLTHWTIVYERDGEDGGVKARLRSTETRTGDDVLTVKEVIPAGTPDGTWQFRNQTRLTRQP